MKHTSLLAFTLLFGTACSVQSGDLPRAETQSSLAQQARLDVSSSLRSLNNSLSAFESVNSALNSGLSARNLNTGGDTLPDDLLLPSENDRFEVQQNESQSSFSYTFDEGATTLKYKRRYSEISSIALVLTGTLSTKNGKAEIDEATLKAIVTTADQKLSFDILKKDTTTGSVNWTFDFGAYSDFSTWTAGYYSQTFSGKLQIEANNLVTRISGQEFATHNDGQSYKFDRLSLEISNDPIATRVVDVSGSIEKNWMQLGTFLIQKADVDASTKVDVTVH